MSRFKTSKYKNALSHVYKQEQWINDCNVSSHLSSRGNLIDASREFVAFTQDPNYVNVLPLDSGGRFTKFPTISESASDLSFSPFHDGLLATGGSSGIVKLWEVPRDLPNDTLISKPTASLPQSDGKIEMLRFNPTADNVLMSCSGNQATVWDIEAQASLYGLQAHQDLVQCVSWNNIGSMAATICKKDREKSIKLFDPRGSTTPVSESFSHSALKDSRVLWLGDYLVSSGCNASRMAELALWDPANFSKPVSRVSLSSSGSGSTMLFYDEDTKMLYSCVKNESTIAFYELSGTTLSQGSHVYRGSQQIKGLALAPKSTVNVMACQIARLFALTQHAVIPMSYHVQRKSHTEFHNDLFPDTRGSEPSMTVSEWKQGENKPVSMISLDPSKQHSKPKTVIEKKSADPPKKSIEPVKPAQQVKPVAQVSKPTESVERETVSRPSKVIQLVRSSKLRHIDGVMGHRSTTIDKIPPLNTTVPGDCNTLHANRDRVASVLARPGGQIVVLELNKPGRLDTDTVPTLQNKADVMDFAFDPFDNTRLISACDDGYIRLWSVPAGGLTETLTEPLAKLEGHRDKPNIIAFHPLASSVLATAGYDLSLKVWNLDAQKPVIDIPLKEPLFALSWSPCGQFLATFSKDGALSLWDPRSSTAPVREGTGPEGRRGGRLVWLDSEHIVVSGFNKQSCRTLTLYSTADLSKHMSVISLDVSPATLMPVFDSDLKLLYVSGKGDTSVKAFEYVPDKSPFLFDVAPISCPSAHQGFVILPKVMCDVRKVEIAHGVRLTPSTVERFLVKVPRTRLEFFQDDLYPPTAVYWEPTATAQEWFSGGKPKERATINLTPADMKPLSEAPAPKQAPKKYESYNPKFKTDQEKKEELMSAMINRMGDKDDDPLPQASQDGVDSDEWSD